MTKSSPFKMAWRSKTARKSALICFAVCFASLIALGTFVREEEQKTRSQTLVNTAASLASTALSSGTDDPTEILLKVNDLLNIDSVLGIQLVEKNTTPLDVGDVSKNLPKRESLHHHHHEWSQNNTKLDIALKLDKTLPYDWLILRLDADKQIDPPLIGTLINFIAAPIIAFITGLCSLWAFGRFVLKPNARLSHYLETSAGAYNSSPVPQEITNLQNETGLLAKQIEAMREEIVDAKNKIDFQASFMHETPFPLIRCSVNRKILYANVAARAQSILFGDESKEFISPALSEVVRKAFYEAKQVDAEIRGPKYIHSFRAIPVLDAGYVNLYGLKVNKLTDDTTP